MNATTETKTPTVKVEGIKAGLFNGLLKNWQQTAWTDMVHAGIDKRLAHKIASDYGADLGRAMVADGKFKSKIGKLDDDGQRKIRMAAAPKAIATSNPMSIVYVVQTMDTLFVEELLASRKLPALSIGLQEYLAEQQEWCNGQHWLNIDEKEN